jgi:hypothetical protein
LKREKNRSFPFHPVSSELESQFFNLLLVGSCVKRADETLENEQDVSKAHNCLQEISEPLLHSLEHQHGVSLLGGSIQCLLWMQLQLCCCHLKQTEKSTKKERKHRFISWKEKENGEWRERK